MFQGYQGLDDKQRAAKEKLAQALLREATTGTPQNAAEGINALAAALIGRNMDRRLNALQPNEGPAPEMSMRPMPRPQQRPALDMMGGAGVEQMLGGSGMDAMAPIIQTDPNSFVDTGEPPLPGGDMSAVRQGMTSIAKAPPGSIGKTPLKDAMLAMGLDPSGLTPAQMQAFEAAPVEVRRKVLSSLVASPETMARPAQPSVRERQRISGGDGMDRVRGQAGDDRLGTAGEVGSFGTEDATMNRRIQEANMNARAGLARLSNIDDMLRENPDLLDNSLTWTGDMRRRWLAFRDKLGVEAWDIGPEQERELADSTSFRSAILRNVNRTIQEITGAAMGEQEAKRIRTELPDVSASPTEFKAQLATAMNLLRLDVIRTRMWAERGGEGSAADIPDSEVRRILQDKGRAYFEEALQSMSPVDARLEAARRLSEEYGL